MRWFFDMDNPVMRSLSAAADLLILNVLTLLCCLPLITIGPALTALADGCSRIVREEGGAVTKDFFRCFRARFRRSVLPGLLLLLLAVLLVVDFRTAAVYAPFMRAGIAALGVLLLALSIYFFALLAREGEGLKETLKKAAMLAVAYAPRTVGILIVWIVLWTLALIFIRHAAPVLLMFGLSLPGFVSAMLLRPVFPAR